MNRNEKSVFYALFCLSVVTAVSADRTSCDKLQCRGPVRFYEDLGCKAVYEKAGDCCAIEYDCSHLRNRSPDKCYANGHEYEIGQSIRAEDKTEPCDVGCFCSKNYRGVATFRCAVIDCILNEAKPGCYLRRKLNSCCGAEEICAENPIDIPKCQVDGKIYSDGDRFIPNDNPSILCQCTKGYEGKNVDPFCRPLRCGAEQKHAYELRERCAPIFETSQLPAKNCNWTYRCQNSKDVVLKNESQDKNKGTNTCTFGKLKLKIGDELNESDEKKCVRCACEVPPMLTCQRLTDEECKIKYPRDSQ